jgi:radical SAM superfamily enzyme YgiQ (UPF0313 family)
MNSAIVSGERLPYPIQPMRILLINSNLKDDVLAAPPIGLCYVASAAEEAGHDVKVLDLCFNRDIHKELDLTIRLFCPQVVGISIRNIDNCNMLHPRSYLPDVADIVRQVRSQTHARIVLGGSGASLNPKEVLEFLGADFIVVSEGETAFPALLRTLETGGSVVNAPGVGSLRDGVFQCAPPSLSDFRKSKADVGKWINMKPYQRMGSSYNIQTRRGCRQGCIYCTYNQVLEGNSIRLRDPVDVVDEIEQALAKYKPESFEFVDSVFNDPPDHCIEILEEIIRRPWKAHLTAMGVSPRGLDTAFLKLMWRAGFRSFWITPESASETMIRHYGKGFSLGDIVGAADAINRTRFTVLWDFLIGGPGETNQTLQETLDFILKYLGTGNRPPYYTVNFFVGVRVYPNTRLWKIALQDGFIQHDSDPLDQLWYLSRDLDLDQAIKQLVEAAALCPEIISGIDEKYLALSGIAALLGKVVRTPMLYWRLMYMGNRLLRKTVLRFAFNSDEVVALLRKQLAHQGCSHHLLKNKD